MLQRIHCKWNWILGGFNDFCVFRWSTSAPGRSGTDRTSSPGEWASAWPCPRRTSPSTSTTPRSRTPDSTCALWSSPERRPFLARYSLMSKVMEQSVRATSKVASYLGGLQGSSHVSSQDWKIQNTVYRISENHSYWTCENREEGLEQRRTWWGSCIFALFTVD